MNPSVPKPQADPLGVLTITEAAQQLRCSKTHLYNVLNGLVEGVPPLPAFHVGRRILIRTAELQVWVRALEGREREHQYATGHFGVENGA